MGKLKAKHVLLEFMGQKLEICSFI